MSSSESQTKDTAIYKVIRNKGDQFSIWMDYKDVPHGWDYTGKKGPKADCLAYIKEVWTDMRPLNLRNKIEAVADTPLPAALPGVAAPLLRRSLIDRLSSGDHLVRVDLRPEATTERLKQAIDRGYLHIKFTETQGQTELSFPLDRSASDFSTGDFTNSTGTIRVEGNLVLDYVRIRCIANISLDTLDGNAHFVKLDEAQNAGPGR